jgi:hypothetical protein
LEDRAVVHPVFVVGLVVLGVLVRSMCRRVLRLPDRGLRVRGDRLLIFGIAFLLGVDAEARADSGVELSGATGFGVLVAGVTSARFAVSPSASVSLRGDGWFFVARDTASLLGATGGRFGINNETTLGAGLFGELLNVSAGLSLAEFSLPICGPRLCGQMRGLAPGADLRLDVFGPYLSGSLGISIDCAGSWITGAASAVWSGVFVRCSAGPVLRFAAHS